MDREDLLKNAKPILFNTEMVKAILEGRKTQTRIVFNKYQLKIFDYASKIGEINHLDNLHKNDFSYIKDFSKYKVGDILYVKEKFQYGKDIREKQNIPLNEDIEVLYYENEINNFKDVNKEFAKEIKWKPSIHMPKELSRIFLKVTSVRVEKLQDILRCDIDKEGFIKPSKINAFYWFATNWNSTAKDNYRWEINPYVFVYEFKIIK